MFCFVIYFVIIFVCIDYMGNLCLIFLGGGMYCVNNYRQIDKVIYVSRYIGVIEKDYLCNIMMEFYFFIYYILLLIDYIEGMEW